MEQFLWGIFPYLMITVFVVVHIFRYNTSQLNWTAKSSEFLEKKTLRWGSMLFHIGIIFVFFGHVGGLLVPKSWLETVGVSESMYHASAVYGGGFAGVLTFVGVVILMSRRLSNKRVRATSDLSDNVTIVLLFLIVAVGLYNTLIGNSLNPDFDYRETVSPWVRGLFIFSPDASLMSDVPFGFKLHILLSLLLVGIWPFTRLVHVWSVPIAYIRRSPMIYRKRV